ncbi:FAD binding domain-containing protein [Rhodococcus jostii]|uniref:Carbon-monoxide dehydrogenase medium subunit n=1 Tax=Rhodococcus jostii TaxID=132919 RepID=A0A1H4JK30_RHOJO|nr:xanthine dehydrogenase family protein subunit M [Rhodococcus jostii]SEB46226.1 carbon-monoxide dehydrogenase medium subunit [Rhodococcus jostii]
MKPAAFEYLSPTSLTAAVEALTNTDGGATKVLAGGQSLMPQLNFRLAHPTRIVDINGIAALSEISEADGLLTIGALVRQRTAERSDVVRRACPLLAEAVRLIGYPAIRNRGTIGGSLAHADPGAELPAVAVCLDAEIVVEGPAGERVIPAAEFFTGPFSTRLADDEILTAVRVRSAASGTGAAYEELSRKHVGFAMAGVAAVVRLDGDTVAEARVAVSGVGTTPVRANRAEAALAGQAPVEKAIADAAAAALEGISPTSDLHASAAYRRHVAGVLIRRALTSATTHARENR